ncbi:MAG: hypothetical protein Q4C20_10180 [Erysipelotrichaceae bacterium]|jgi:hypothetical protein|nr:hypothetical protein [Erysipelotrichaceae bacterium]
MEEAKEESFEFAWSLHDEDDSDYTEPLSFDEIREVIAELRF